MLALGKLLGRWRDELFVYTGTVPADRFLSSCTLGAVVVRVEQRAQLPRWTKFTGSNARRGVVIGRHEDPATNTLELELLRAPGRLRVRPQRARSVDRRCEDHAGDGIRWHLGDYAGSAAGYAKTANDYGRRLVRGGLRLRARAARHRHAHGGPVHCVEREPCYARDHRDRSAAHGPNELGDARRRRCDR